MSSKVIKRQVMDQLIVINKQEMFSLKEHFKTILPTFGFERFTKDKRIAYNYKIVELLKRNDLCPEDIYDRLDAAWNRLAGWIESYEKDLFLKCCKILNPLRDPISSAYSSLWELYLEETFTIVKSHVEKS